MVITKMSGILSLTFIKQSRKCCYFHPFFSIAVFFPIPLEWKSASPRATCPLILLVVLWCMKRESDPALMLPFC